MTRPLTVAILFVAAGVAGGCGFAETSEVQQDVLQRIDKLEGDIDRLIEYTAILAAQHDAQMDVDYNQLEMIRELRQAIRSDRTRLEKWQRDYNEELDRIRRDRIAAAAGAAAGR